MKIGKTEVDNNLIFAIVALIVAYIIINKITSGISSGVSTLLGENPKDKEKAEVEEIKSEIGNYSPLSIQYAKNLYEKSDAKTRLILVKKGQWSQAQVSASRIDDILHTLYVTDEDANKIISLIDGMNSKYNVSNLANQYNKITKGANLELDMKKYLDQDEIAELFKRINKKPIM